MSPSKSIPSWQVPIEFQAFRLIPGHEAPERAWATCSAQASPWNLLCRVLEWGIGELDRGFGVGGAHRARRSIAASENKVPFSERDSWWWFPLGFQRCVTLVIVHIGFLEVAFSKPATNNGRVAQHNNFHRAVSHLGHHVLPTPAPTLCVAKREGCSSRTGYLSDGMHRRFGTGNPKTQRMLSLRLTPLAKPLERSVVLFPVAL